MKTTVVVFDKIVGARILVNPSPEQYQGRVHLLNPSFAKVEHLSPHEWDLVNGSLVPAAKAVVAKRSKVLHTPVVFRKRFNTRLALDCFLVGAILSLVVMRVLHV